MYHTIIKKNPGGWTFFCFFELKCIFNEIIEEEG
jgi:hypothetical protein